MTAANSSGYNILDTRDRARDGTGSIWRLQEELDGSAGLDDLDGPGDSEDLDDLERFRQTGRSGKFGYQDSSGFRSRESFSLFEVQHD